MVPGLQTAMGTRAGLGERIARRPVLKSLGDVLQPLRATR
jgi:hypothetical protein